MAIAEIVFALDPTAGQPFYPLTGKVVNIYNPDLNGGADMLLTESGVSGRYVNASVDKGSYQVWIDGTHLTGTRHKRFEPFSAEEISTAGLKDDSVTTNKIGTGQVGSDNLGSQSVTNPKIGEGAVGDNSVLDGSMTPTELAAQTVVVTSVNTLGTGKYIGQSGRSASGYQYVLISLTVTPYWELTGKLYVTELFNGILWQENFGVLFPKTTPTVGLSLGCPLQNVTDPIGDQDGATKIYVDKFHELCGYHAHLAGDYAKTLGALNTFLDIPPGIFTVVGSENFDVIGNDIFYRGLETILFEITWAGEVHPNADTVIGYFGISKNGVGIGVTSDSVSRHTLPTDKKNESYFGKYVVELKTDDYITFQVASDTAGIELTLGYPTLTIRKFYW